MKHILYLAKEPGKGVRDDLSRLSGKEVTVVDCLGAYGDYYRKMGYNVISKTKYFELDGTMRFDVVIGNPPYGSGANLAVKFVNKAAELSDDIRMVLPLSFKKVSIQNKVSLDISVVEERDLPENTFPNGIRAVYQRWAKTGVVREKVVTYTKHPDFNFIDDKHTADFMIGRTGGGPAGRIKTENFSHYSDEHYFMKATPEVLNNFLSIADQLRALASKGNGRKTLSKHDIVTCYMENFGGGYEQEQTQ